ncbi:hypothetical protein [Venatoribacter cucullus]|uniref:Uncharacterized protein n=1 Tax=Venatoribacter cucullus TaxID=2661630 RepID=A0A9X7UV38_9GAMM|nr:hypothetical protein [Venatoribacter cucullus]QQD23529.1 hypothetical protein GJQ55_03090 [Venatoribacter cucullus]
MGAGVRPSLLKRLQLDDMISDHQDDYQRRAFATLPEALAWLDDLLRT